MSGPGLALVLGLGRFGGGREAARFLHRRGWRLRIADRASAAELDPNDELRDLRRAEWRLGEQGPGLLEGADLLVVNPAVPGDHPVLRAAAARGVPVTQEVELFLAAYPGRVVLVTGTNGKSTTSTLLAAALRASGVPALLGGNIGHSLLADESRWSDDQVAVVEISSFQLERLDAGRHPVAGAVLTRITSDHLDRHGSLQAYRAAKAAAAAAARDFVVHLANDDVAAGYPTAAPRRVTVQQSAPAPGQVGLVGGWITSRLEDAGPVLHRDAPGLLGAFHLDNLMLAYAAACLLGGQRQRVAAALAAQAPLPHRLQLVAQRGGVRLYDNGVSTALESTLSAMQSLAGPVHWIGGGKSKDGDFAAVAGAVAPQVASAHLFGAAAGPLGRLLRGRCPVTVHEPLEAALDAAAATARPGAALLFSPAFASFDQFPNYRARAERFAAWARAWRGGSTTAV